MLTRPLTAKAPAKACRGIIFEAREILMFDLSDHSLLTIFLIGAAAALMCRLNRSMQHRR